MPAPLVSEKLPPRSLTVLLVEDETIVALDAQDTVEELGCRVIGYATNAVDAERLAADQVPDLILMDIRINGSIDGIEAASRLRTWYKAPIIFVSGSVDDTLRERIGRMPFTAILHKPFSQEELRGALVWACGQRVEQPAEDPAT